MPPHAVQFVILPAALLAGEPPAFVDRTDAIAPPPDAERVRQSHVLAADLDDDGFPDLVLDRHLVLMNRPAGPDDPRAIGTRRFERLDPATTGLDAPDRATVRVFADLDNDRIPDAITAEFRDVGNSEWSDHGRPTRWQPGNGDGTFASARPIDVPPRPTIAIAVADVDRDGRLDLWLGNTYRWYGRTLEAWPTDLLLQRPTPDGAVRFDRVPLPEDGVAFDRATDAGARPTFGTRIWHDPRDQMRPSLLGLGYGRRWNRLWRLDDDGEWVDRAPALGVDGDAVRHGRHPAWLTERARTDPRFARDDEPPFRANGNTFHADVGDVDGDGRLDLLVTEITHAWAGESSDRTRVLFATPDGAFEERPSHTLDRVPDEATDPRAARSWNQGDLFGAFADLDGDGRLEVIVSSGEYPDDERLRAWRSTANGFDEIAIGVRHDGSLQISLADFDGDGALDLAAGQSFNRMTAAQREGRVPTRRLLHGARPADARFLLLRLRLDAPDVNARGIGTIARVTLPDGRVLVRPLLGAGGHAGTQHDDAIHVGLGEHDRATRVELLLPTDPVRTIVLEDVPAGHWWIAHDGTRHSIGKPSRDDAP